MSAGMKKLTAVLIAAILLAAAACANTADPGKTGENGPLDEFEEVRELNEALEMPLPLGASESEVRRKGFESFDSSVEHSLMRFRSADAKDVTYTVGTRELRYGEPDPSAGLYVTGFRVTAASSSVKKNDDGSTTVVYSSPRSALGVSVGDMIGEAREKLLARGYTALYEEPKREGLPKTYEHSFRKGVIVFTLGAENDGSISQLSVWIPYYAPEIDALNERSSLPAELGLIYSAVANPAFGYAGKDATSRRYEAEDGSADEDSSSRSELSADAGTSDVEPAADEGSEGGSGDGGTEEEREESSAYGYDAQEEVPPGPGREYVRESAYQRPYDEDEDDSDESDGENSEDEEASDARKKHFVQRRLRALLIRQKRAKARRESRE